ncbi:hypothetical protein NE237_019175 [Protea cynaroides]|uniref:Uncharacterized protein n=1 Tax=Protea cynaroides TaxID=273540 RepID=A0A9Q0KBH9_9MAGN|nr:hypothetical protein NE237_019175 [Protea cynaroides]
MVSVLLSSGFILQNRLPQLHLSPLSQTQVLVLGSQTTASYDTSQFPSAPNMIVDLASSPTMPIENIIVVSTSHVVPPMNILVVLPMNDLVISASSYDASPMDPIIVPMNGPTNVPTSDALAQIPAYVKFLKEIMSNKQKLKDYETIALTEECSAVIQNKLPPKLRDPGSFSIPCTIGEVDFSRALCDLGASVSLMPLSVEAGVGVCTNHGCTRLEFTV